MGKKIMLVAIILVAALGIFVVGTRRARMLSQPLQAPGGLVAVSSDGKTISLPASAVTTKMPENMAMQQVDGTTVSITLDPYPPTGFNPADFEVTLTDANGHVINDATISLDLTMPTMWMPPNQLTLTPTSSGKYSATGQFTMRGLWRIEVIIMHGTKTQSAFFDVGL